MQSNAASNAAKTVGAAGAANSQFLNGVNTTLGNNVQPTVNQGLSAGGAIGGLLGLNGTSGTAAQTGAFNNYLNSTNYQFQLGQGLQGVEYANAPAFQSGGTGKALNNYAQGMAGNALSGYEGLLTGQQSLGQQGALGMGQIGAQLGSTLSNSNLLAAGAQASAGIYGANAIDNAMSGVNSALGFGSGQSSFGGQGGNALSGLFGGGGAGGSAASSAMPASMAGLF